MDIHEEPFALATAEVLLLRALRRRRPPVVLYTAQNLPQALPDPVPLVRAVGAAHCGGHLGLQRAMPPRIVVGKGFAGRARVIPLGIDLARFRPTDARPRRRTTTGQADARSGPSPSGLLGRLVPEKGVELLLRAAALRTAAAAADRRLRTAGRIDPAARCERSGVAERGRAGRRDPARRGRDFYRSVDVLAVPSLPTTRWTEQFGRVAVEAMACGVPVVASDAGALPDVVGGAGIVVPQATPQPSPERWSRRPGPAPTSCGRRGSCAPRECTWDAVARRLPRPVPLGAPRAAVIRAADSDRLEIVVVAYGAPGSAAAALEPVVGMPVTVVDNSSLPEIAALAPSSACATSTPGATAASARA